MPEYADKGIAREGGLLVVELYIANNTGAEYTYTQSQFSALVFNSSSLEAIDTTSIPSFSSGETVASGSQALIQLVFDYEAIDGMPTVVFSPIDSADKVSITIPDVTDIHGYND